MPRGRKPAFAAREAVCGVVCQFRFSSSPLQGAARGDISANRRICAKAFRQCTRLLRIVRLKLLAVVLNRVSRKARVGSGEAESRHDCAGVAAYGACAAVCDIEAHGIFRYLRKFAAHCGRNGAPPAVGACKLCAAALADENFGGQYASKPEKWLPPPSMGMPTFPVSLPSHCAARACVVCGGFVPSTEGWPELFISSPAVCAFLRSNRAGRGDEFCRQFVHTGTCGFPTP